MKLQIVIMLLLQLFQTIFSLPESPKCNYAEFTEGGRLPLDHCRVSDQYHLSFMSDSLGSDTYHSSDCSGNSTFSAYSEGEPSYTKTDTAKTCPSALFIYKWHVFDSNGSHSDTLSELEIEEEGLNGDKSTIVRGSRIRVISLMYGNCYKLGLKWMRILGCEENVDGIAGNDVITEQTYYDEECTEEIEFGQYVGVTWSDDIEITYAKTVSEGNPRAIYRYKDTQKKKYELIPYDVVCYKSAVIKDKKDKKDKEAIQYYDNLGAVRNDHENIPIYDQPKNVPLPQNPLYNEPRAPLYNEPRAPLYNEPRAPLYDAPQEAFYNQPQEAIYNPPQEAMYLAVNVLVSIVCTLCVISVCLTAYYCMQNKSNHGPVRWTKVEDCQDTDV